MDLQQLSAVVAASEQVVTFTVSMPSGEPYTGPDGQPCTISHTGPESKAYRMARDQITRRALRQRKSRLEPEDLLKNRIDLAAAPVTGWTGWTNGDQLAPATPENIKAVLAVDHILTQLEESIQNHGAADFFAKK